MDEQTRKFEAWAVVEVMGHSVYAGFVTEQAIGGASFVRVDVPEVEKVSWGGEKIVIPRFTKLLGSSSIFAITPCTEEVARKEAAARASELMTIVDLAIKRQDAIDAPVADRDEDFDGYDDDDE